MRVLLLITLLMLLSSCATQQFKTGQRFSENSPDFYLSLAPSFGTPYEYEVNSGKIIFRRYSGKGGYDWKDIVLVAKKEISVEQQEEIRALAVTAIKDATLEEQKGIDIVVSDGTGWYILSNYGFGPFLSISTNNPPDSFYEIKRYVENIFADK